MFLISQQYLGVSSCQPSPAQPAFVRGFIFFFLFLLWRLYPSFRGTCRFSCSSTAGPPHDGCLSLRVSARLTAGHLVDCLVGGVLRAVFWTLGYAYV